MVRAPPDWDSAGSLVLRCPDYPGPAANGAAGWLPPDVAPLQVHSECPQAVAFTAAFPMDGGEHACTQDEGLGGDQAPDYGSGMCVTRRVTLRPNQTAVIDATRAGPGGGLPAGSWFSAYVARLQDADDPSPTRYWLSAVAQPRSRCFWPGAEWSNLPEAQPTEDTFYVWAPLPQVRVQGEREAPPGLAGRPSEGRPRACPLSSVSPPCWRCRRGPRARPQWPCSGTPPLCCAAHPSTKPETALRSCARRLCERCAAPRRCACIAAVLRRCAHRAGCCTGAAMARLVGCLAGVPMLLAMLLACRSGTRPAT